MLRSNTRQLGGFAVEVDNSCDDWDYERAADRLLGRLRELRRGVSRACLISGGEVTVKVRESRDRRTQPAIRALLRAADNRREHHCA